MDSTSYLKKNKNKKGYNWKGGPDSVIRFTLSYINSNVSLTEPKVRVSYLINKEGIVETCHFTSDL